MSDESIILITRKLFSKEWISDDKGNLYIEIYIQG